MRIHTSTCKGKFIEAAAFAGVTLELLEHHGSRSHLQAFEVILSGSNSRYMNSPHYADRHAATWDEWGIFLNYIYNYDSQMKTAAYNHRLDFHWQTNDRFRDLTRNEQHRTHRWYYVAWSGEHRCEICSARRRSGHYQD
jgi:hypothetical protein